MNIKKNMFPAIVLGGVNIFVNIKRQKDYLNINSACLCVMNGTDARFCLLLVLKRTGCFRWY